jgi:hypothetical protein
VVYLEVLFLTKSGPQACSFAKTHIRPSTKVGWAKHDSSNHRTSGVGISRDQLGSFLRTCVLFITYHCGIRHSIESLSLSSNKEKERQPSTQTASSLRIEKDISP